jgi:Tol biopolymer transport system component
LSGSRWPEIERVCQAALERPPELRAAFLVEACGGDDALRREVESLLAQASAANSFIETPALDMSLDEDDAPSGLAVGQRLGTYHVVSCLGAGGMGEVYRARDTELGRDVALKVLPPTLLKDPERLARFEREARVLAALNHPNVGAIYGLANDVGVRALVLELVEGETLAEKLANSRSGALPVTEALTIARQIADALEAAHEKGIIHRDLKPANIALTRTGVVKVLDFGLAKLAPIDGYGSSPENPSHSPTLIAGRTHAGLLLGTARYVSPEQARGQAVDKRTDIWAFGCVLYEMLTGQAAFPGATVTDTLAAIIEREPEWTKLPAALTGNIRTLLRRCLEKEPSRRLRDIGDARLEIDEAGTEPVGDDANRTVAKSRRSVWVARAAAALFLLTTLVAAGIAYLTRPARDTRVYRTTFVPPTDLANLPGGRLALSPDGQRLAFTAPGSDGRVVLWVRALDTLAAQPLAGTEDALGPFWSPDSRFIGFVAGGKLKKINASGGPASTVIENSAPGFTWNHDDLILFNQTLSEQGSSPIFRVAASGGVPTPVTEPDTKAGETHTTFPTFLPDGRHFLYVRASGDVRGTYIGSLDSPDRIRLLDGWTNVRYASGHLLYVRGTTLVAQPFDPRRLTTTGPPVPLAEHIQVTGNYDVGAFSVSETGVLVYQARASDEEESRLVWYDRAGHQIGVLGDRAAYLWLPGVTLSPDGRRVAVSVRDPLGRVYTVPGSPLPKAKFDIWIFDIARGIRTRFTLDPTNTAALSPIWSPDGRRVVFASDRRGHSDLYQKPAGGAGAEELLLADDTDKLPESWSPDGRFILYDKPVNTPNGDLWVLPLFGDRKPFPLLQSPFDEGAGQFSPDGRWVAYSSDESGRLEVYVTPFPGHGEKVRVSTAGGIEPRWRRDGKEIFYLAGPTGFFAPTKVMAAQVRLNEPHFEVGTVQPLFNVRMPLYPAHVYDVSADGRFLIDTMEEQTPITFVVNWPALLRK